MLIFERMAIDISFPQNNISRQSSQTWAKSLNFMVKVAPYLLQALQGFSARLEILKATIAVVWHRNLPAFSSSKGLVSKILRAVPDVGKIYVLVRPKKGVDPLERVKDILAKDPILGKDAPDSQLKRDISSSLNHRLIPIVGDILLPGLGISPADRETLTRDVHVIFHLAAMVSFKPDPQTYLEAHVRAIAE